MAEVAEILNKTRKGGSETLVALDDAKSTKVWRPTASLSSGGQAQQATAPAQGISGQLETLSNQRSETAQFLPQFTQAIQSATAEAGRNRQANLIGAGVGAAAGPSGVLAPGTAGSIVAGIKSHVGPAVEQVFGGAVRAVSATIQAEEAERQTQLEILKVRQQIENENFDRLTQLATSGALAETPNDALEAMAGNAGIDTNIVLAWKSRIAEANKMGDERKELELEKLRADIKLTQANTAKARRGPAGDKDDASSTAFDFLTADIQDRIINGESREQIISGVTDAAIARGADINDEGVTQAINEHVDNLISSQQQSTGGDSTDEAPPLTQQELDPARSPEFRIFKAGVGAAGKLSSKAIDQSLKFDRIKNEAVNKGLDALANGIGNIFGSE